MRFMLPVLMFSALATGAAAEPRPMVTAQDGILCMSPASLHQAHEPAVAKSQDRLRALGCLRIEQGIRLTLLDGPKIGGPWRIRFYPQGISAGLTLWALPSSFTEPDGSPFLHRRAGS
jgi:hypothetical protein